MPSIWAAQKSLTSGLEAIAFLNKNFGEIMMSTTVEELAWWQKGTKKSA